MSMINTVLFTSVTEITFTSHSRHYKVTVGPNSQRAEITTTLSATPAIEMFTFSPNHENDHRESPNFSYIYYTYTHVTWSNIRQRILASLKSSERAEFEYDSAVSFATSGSKSLHLTCYFGKFTSPPLSIVTRMKPY